MNTAPLNRIEISKEKLLANTQALKEINPQIKIAPVLKSNAYGHGIELIGPILDKEGFPFFCVNSLDEAIALRESGVESDILIMGYVNPENLKEKQWDFIFALFDLEYAKVLNEYQENPRVHLNVETGLHREGVDFLRFENLLSEIKNLPKIKVEGLMSHLAYSNDPQAETTKMQLENYKKAKELVASYGFTPQWFHLGGSLALLNNLSEHCNVVRCGKAFFGIALNVSYSGSKGEASEDSKFTPIMDLKTQIAQVKEIRQGDKVSYADGFIAPKDMTIGILPIGYSDGVDRRLIGKGKVKVNGVFCDFLGVIAMNVTVVDLSELPGAKVNDEVVVYSADPKDANSLDNTAVLCSTLPQDILVHLIKDIERKFV